MARPHKKAGAAMSVQTKLPGNQLQMICHDLSESCKKVGQKIVVSGQSASQMSFAIQGGIIKKTLMSFRVNILDRGKMRGMSSEIVNYTISQQRVMLIPVTPKMIEGFGLYKMFMDQAVAAVKQADPSAETSVRDR